MKRLVFFTALLLAFPALAQVGQRIIHLSLGTGFFVNRDGYVITNHHVVKQCKSVTVEGAVSRRPAVVIGFDETNDLALLKAETIPPASASLRDEADPLQVGERVITVGFPGGIGPVMKDTSLIDVKGPLGEPQWLQFADMVKQGNSGGPLLDGAGNVIGVVMAKAVIYKVNDQSGEKQTVGNSDVAIRLSMLRGFLTQHNVSWRDEMSGVMTSAHYVDDRAREYIVKVTCEQD